MVKLVQFIKNISPAFPEKVKRHNGAEYVHAHEEGYGYSQEVVKFWYHQAHPRHNQGYQTKNDAYFNNKTFQLIQNGKRRKVEIKSFYLKDSKNVRFKDDETLYVCTFCGYISVDSIPEPCPICSAEKTAFKQID